MKILSNALPPILRTKKKGSFFVSLTMIQSQLVNGNQSVSFSESSADAEYFFIVHSGKAVVNYL
jgi:hypothetical protein